MLDTCGIIYLPTDAETKKNLTSSSCPSVGTLSRSRQKIMWKKTANYLIMWKKRITFAARDMERNLIIDNIKQVAKTSLPKGSSLLLYGSQARGDARKGSDWDLLILLDKPELTCQDYGVGYPFRCLGWDIDVEINPQVYSKKEWASYSYTPFYKNVEHDKIVLL